MGRGKRLITGIFLLLLIGGIAVFLAPFTLGRIVLDVDGTAARGSITDKRLGSFWSRYRGRIGTYHLTVSFEDGVGTKQEADYSVSERLYETASPGQGLKITYWRPLPYVSAIEPTPWDDFGFVAVFVVEVIVIMLCFMVAYRTFVPPPDG